MDASTGKGRAGFGRRLAAAAIDLLLAGLAVKAAAWLLGRAGVYIPFELTLICAFVVYAVLCVGLCGATLGKWLAGARVEKTPGGPPGLPRALLRETVAKTLSVFPIGLGFLWIAFARSKRGWHDLIAGTTVTREVRPPRVRLAFAASLVACLFVVTAGVLRTALDLATAARMSPPADSAMPCESRDPSALIEISSLSEDDRAAMAEWLDENAAGPIDYAVRVASEHDLVIFGEVHEQRDCLLFLNDLIPELYSRAGVTCVGLEVCLARDNDLLQRLVTAPEFDRELALRIARHGPWGMWGFKEYWDVLETVWRVNAGREDGDPALRLVGIDVAVDGPSLGLVTGAEGGRLQSAVWEKLRILRLPDDLARFIKRDELMAASVERQVLALGERGIVWVGSAHSYTHYRQAMVVEGQVVRRLSRMGVLLRARHGDGVYQIALHDPYFEPVMREVLEPVMALGGGSPAGFDVVGSPFASLRDGRDPEYAAQPGLCLADVARGYIFLAPRDQLRKCTWLEGYISDGMFARDRPYYQAWARLGGEEVRTAEEADRVLGELMTH